ncbi:MAG: hypothetical protein O7C56_06880, partial [Rickettsia endosymbiont of Ixodes persulcatus]|nr:hypothetical protein [Rickettsia endosymbiont of Ixodes persulcatus]
TPPLTYCSNPSLNRFVMGNIVNVPRIDNTTGIVVRKQIKRGWVALNLAQRNSLSNFFSGKIEMANPS